MSVQTSHVSERGSIRPIKRLLPRMDDRNDSHGIRRGGPAQRQEQGEGQCAAHGFSRDRGRRQCEMGGEGLIAEVPTVSVLTPTACNTESYARLCRHSAVWRTNPASMSTSKPCTGS